MFLARNMPAFVIAYLVLMIPTYILPYFGSNSSLVNALSVSQGMGMLPQWWMHIWFLVMLTLLVWLRGSVIGKAYLPVFPVIAAIFDMTPGLSMIPMIPTVMHLVGIILGAMGVGVLVTEEAAINREQMLGRKAKIVAGIATLLAIGGSTLFVTTLSSGHHKQPALVAETQVKPAVVQPPVNTVAEVQPQPMPAETQAASAPLPATLNTQAHKHHKVVNDYQTATTKSVKSEKQTVRYFNLNE
jgi:hypothetical protein